MNFYVNTPTAELTIRCDKNSPDKFSLHNVESVQFAETRRFGKRFSVTDLIITDEDGDQIKITLFNNTAEGVEFFTETKGILASKIKLEGNVQ
tara:strand:- start:587 stop:865 length:279 start_codon:yes stop_codon:yes gene_type:complete